MNFFDVFVINPIFNALMLIYSIVPGGDIGVTILLFTIVVRFLLYPLVKRQLYRSRIMQKLQPEILKIKKQSNGNKQQEAMQTMELYKKYDVSPFRSIGVLFIQIPIFLGLFYSVRILTVETGDIAKRIYDFMESIGPIKQLIDNPDNINHLMFGFINLSDVAISSKGVVPIVLILAGLSALTQYFMSRQTMPSNNSNKGVKGIMKEASEGKQADPAEMNAAAMQTMVKVMPVMTFFIMINLPSALTLYYTISNIIAVAQQAYIIKNYQEPEIESTEIKSDSNKKTKSNNTKKREKNAKEANITKIKAKDSKSKKRR